MRKSHRGEILDAAFRVIGRDGVRAMTYESIAQEAQLTKGGLLYHFPSREELIAALHEHLAVQWEEGLVAALGDGPSRPSTQERSDAYVLSTIQSATRAELLFLLETADEHASTGPWEALISRWAPPAPTLDADEETVDAFIARLAADGLWLYEALGVDPLPDQVRHRIAQRIITRTPPRKDTR